MRINKENPARGSEPQHYSGVLEVFRRFKVKQINDLEKLLATSSMNGAVCGDYAEWATQTSGAYLARSLCAEISSLAANANSIYGMHGIQQFSFSAEPRIREEDLKKALFLANSATIISPHSVSFTYDAVTAQWGQDQIYQEWRMDPDFVRDLFMYKNYLQDGSLILLPREAQFVHRDQSDKSEGTEHRATLEALAPEISTTRVLNISIDSSLLDRIIAQYHRSRQLVVLPDIQIPWIDGINLDQISNIRMDHNDELSRFQHAYHQAMLDFIENYQSLDFSAISDAICSDIIDPSLRSLKRSYKRTISTQRSLTAIGATVGTLPVAGAIVSGELLGSISTAALASGGTSFIAAILGAFALNRIQRKSAAAAIEDSSYAVLWRIGGLAGRMAA